MGLPMFLFQEKWGRDTGIGESGRVYLRGKKKKDDRKTN